MAIFYNINDNNMKKKPKQAQKVINRHKKMLPNQSFLYKPHI